jgi:hypothetical protein
VKLEHSFLPSEKQLWEKHRLDILFTGRENESSQSDPKQPWNQEGKFC